MVERCALIAKSWWQTCGEIATACPFADYAEEERRVSARQDLPGAIGRTTRVDFSEKITALGYQDDDNPSAPRTARHLRRSNQNSQRPWKSAVWECPPIKDARSFTSGGVLLEALLEQAIQERELRPECRRIVFVRATSFGEWLLEHADCWSLGKSTAT